MLIFLIGAVYEKIFNSFNHNCNCSDIYRLWSSGPKIENVSDKLLTGGSSKSGFQIWRNYQTRKFQDLIRIRIWKEGQGVGPFGKDYQPKGGLGG